MENRFNFIVKAKKKKNAAKTTFNLFKITNLKNVDKHFYIQSLTGSLITLLTETLSPHFTVETAVKLIFFPDPQQDVFDLEDKTISGSMSLHFPNRSSPRV